VKARLCHPESASVAKNAAHPFPAEFPVASRDWFEIIAS
jgi:hypothetical protein